MDFHALRHQMVQNAKLIRSLVSDVSPEQARWKPAPDRWSILEVINHLYDEEKLDFRVRLDIILHEPEKEWPPIHPFAWVTERKYNERELKSSLQHFMEERQASITWLHGLGEPDWEAKATANFGDNSVEMRAGDMYASWVIHDHWHIQQLLRLRRDYTIAQVAPYDVRYAGEL